MRTLRAFLALTLKLKLYPSVEKVFMVDELDITVVFLLLLLGILWLGHGVRFTHLLCDLPEGAGTPIQSEEGGKGGEVGAVVDVGAD